MSTAEIHKTPTESTTGRSPHGAFEAVRYTLAEQGAPWIFIVAARSVVAIKAPSEPDVVEGLWALMRGGESRADALAALIPEFTGGQRTVFSVVGDDEPAGGSDPAAEPSTVTVITHGVAVADGLRDAASEGSPPGALAWARIRAVGDAPWAREVVEGSRKFALGDLAHEVGVDAAGVSFPLDAGVVVANRLDLVLPGGADAVATPAEPEPEAAAVASPATGASSTSTTSSAPPTSSAPDTSSAAAASAEPDASPTPVAASAGVPAAVPTPTSAPADLDGNDNSSSSETSLTRRVAEETGGGVAETTAPASGAVVLEVSDPAGGMDGEPLTKAPGVPASVEAETETVIRPRRSIVPRLTDAALQRHDGETVLRPDIARPIDDETVFRHVPFVPDDPQTVMYGFRVNGGQAYPLDAVHYFGRNPRQPRIPLPDPSRLVPVVSSTKSVSATHLEIKQVGDSIVATDLTSTNGTSINLPHKHWQRLRQGESIVVVPGTLIDIGDGNVIEILPPWPGE